MYAKQLIQIENITIEELKKELLLEIKQLLIEFNKEQVIEEELIDRKEVAKLFKISLVTVSDWTKKNILPAYRIGRKVVYKKSEVLASLNKMNRF